MEKNNNPNLDAELVKFKEEKLKDLSEEQINTMGKKTKNTHMAGFIVTICFCALFLIGGIMSIVIAKNSVMILVAIIFLVLAFVIMKPKMFKWDLKTWADFKLENDYKHIKYEENKKIEDEKQKIQQEINNSSVDGKKIKHTKIVDSYTEVTDKLHAILNYQEIIQHRMYKFLVTFEDNSTGIYTAEQDSKLYNKLIRFLVDENQEKNSSKSDVAEEIAKYKKLLDEGTITEEEFKQLKDKLIH